jgi:periplasmic protein TonB
MAGFAQNERNTPITGINVGPLVDVTLVLAGAGATILHVALVAIAASVGAHFARQVTQGPSVTRLVDVELPTEVSPPREPPLPVPVPVPTSVRTPSEHRVKPTPPAEPPAAVPAGPPLTAADELVHFDEPIGAGNGTGHAGDLAGVGEGKPEYAVREGGARNGGAPPAPAAPPAVDRSRAARLAGGSAWDCPFPVEADDAGIDHAVVSLRIEVGVDGHMLSASAVRDPEHGFAREARRCALSKRWSVGLDRRGQPINSTTIVNVRFDR